MLREPPVTGKDFLEALDDEAVRLRVLVPKVEAKEAREREANLELAALPEAYDRDLFQRYHTINQRQLGRLSRDLAQAEDRASRRPAALERPRRTKAILRNEPTGASGAAAGSVATRRIQKANGENSAHDEHEEHEVSDQQTRTHEVAARGGG